MSWFDELAGYAGVKPAQDWYTNETDNSNGEQDKGLLASILSNISAASDWVGNNVDYVENGAPAQWLAGTPMGQGLRYLKALPDALITAKLAEQGSLGAFEPSDNNTYSGSLRNSFSNGVANTVGGIADFAHLPMTAEVLQNLAQKTNDEDAVDADFNMDYITSPHGFTRSVGNALGSMAATLPAMALPMGEVSAGLKAISPWLARGARYGMTAIPEAMSEGGNTMRQARQQGLDHADLRGYADAALNLPLLAVSNTLEGALFAGGFGKMFKANPNASLGANLVRAPFRAVPNALAEGTQNGLEEAYQQAIQNGTTGQEYGILPWNWTDDQKEAALEGFFGTLPMGAASGAYHGAFKSSNRQAQDALNDAESLQAISKDNSTPATDGHDVTSMSPDTYMQWVNSQLSDLNIDVPNVSMPQTQGAQGNAQSNQQGGMPTFNDKAYTITGEVSDTALTGGTEQKLNALAHAYKDKFGEDLQVTSMKRHGNGESWHDSGQAFDVAGGGLESNENGERDFLMQKGQELGLVPLDEYANPSAHATGGHIHFSDHEGGEAKQSTQGGNAESKVSDSLTGSQMANEIAANTGLPANFIWAQMAHESANFSSDLAKEDHNYSGLTGEDGNYLHFDSDADYVKYMSDYLPKYRENGIYNAKTVDEYAQALHDGGYFTDTVENYAGDMKRLLSGNNMSDDAMASNKQNVSLNDFADMLTNKLTDFADTNDTQVRAIFDDLGQAEKDKAAQALFAPFLDANGNTMFRNTAEVRAALASNEAFRQFARRYIMGNMAKYVPKEIMDAGRMTVEQARKLLAPKAPTTRAGGKADNAQVKAQNASQTAQQAVQGTPVPQVNTNMQGAQGDVTSAMVEAAIPDFVSTMQNVTNNPQDATFIQSLLNSNGQFINTPENQFKVMQHFGLPALMQFTRDQQAQVMQGNQSENQTSSQLPNPSASTQAPAPVDQVAPNTAQAAQEPTQAPSNAPQVQTNASVQNDQQTDAQVATPYAEPQQPSVQSVKQQVVQPIDVPQTAEQAQTQQTVANKAQQVANAQNAAGTNVLSAQATPNSEQGANHETTTETAPSTRAENQNQNAEPEQGSAAEPEQAAQTGEVKPLFESGEHKLRVGKRKGKKTYTAKLTRKLTQGEGSLSDLKEKAKAHNGKWNPQFGGFNFNRKSDRDAFVNEANNGGGGQSTQKQAETAEQAQQAEQAQPSSAMAWIAAHPFQYDKSKSVEENIVAAEAYAQAFIDQFGTTDQINTPERQALRKQIADELYGNGAQKKEGKVWLIIGVPASGKSTIANPLVEQNGAILIDSDEAKEKLPEFANGTLATAVHEESSDIASNVLLHAIKNNDNIVMPVVGKIMESLQRKIKLFKDTGYEVNLEYIDLPVEKAVQRVKSRFAETGRLVSPKYLESVGLKPRQNYDKLKTDKGVDAYEAWDNDVPRGASPRLIERSSQSQSENSSGLGGRRDDGRGVRKSDENRDRNAEVEGPANESITDDTESRSDNQSGFSSAQGASINGRKGKTVTVYTDDGTAVQAQYMLVPQSKVITSSTYEGEVVVRNDAYPRELQPRDRDRVAMHMQTDSIAKKMIPDLLGDSKQLNQGAPVIRKDGVVLNGNGRAMGIIHAHELHNDSATAYNKWLAEHAEEFGFTKADVMKLLQSGDKPMLVRVIDDADADTMDSIIHSKAGGSEMGAAEQAMTDAGRIRQRDFVDYDKNSEGDLTTASNMKFVGYILSRLTSGAELNRYLDKHGNVNADGYSRVKRALFAKAYKDTEVIAKMAESTDDDIRNVSKAMEAVAPDIAYINARIESGTLTDAELAETVSRAARKYNDIKTGKAEKDVEAYFRENETAMVGRDPQEVLSMVEAFETFRRSGKKMTEFFHNLARLVNEGKDPNADATALDFGELNRYPSLNEIINVAKGEVVNGREKNLFDRPVGAENNRADSSQPATRDAGEVPVHGGETGPQAGTSGRVQLAVSGREGGRDAGVSNEQETGAPQEEQASSIFGSKEDALKDLEDAFGIKRLDKTPQSDFNKTVDTNNKLFAEAKVSEKDQIEKDIADLSKQLQAELRKLNANPVFNPKIYTLGAQIGVKVIKLGFKTFKPWAEQLLKAVGDDIKPWLKSIWKGINNAPTDREFNAKGYAAAVRYCGNLYENGVTDFDAVANEFINEYGNEVYKNIEGYLRAADAAINEYMHPTEIDEQTKGETPNADDSTGELAARAGERNNQDRVGQADAGERPRTGDQSESVPEAGAESGPQGSTGVRGGSTAAGGETGNRGVQAEKSDDSTSSAGGTELSGGARAGLNGSTRIDDGRKAEDIKPAQDRQIHAAAQRVKTKQQNSDNFEAGNLEQIKNDLPCLQDAQAEDVQFGEQRLFGEKGGEGVLFTNGTGTGKTFTGMGLIKRMINSGRKNILIVSPTSEINKAWVDTAKKYFGVDIHVLKDTTDAGKEGQVCVTTYANFQQNEALVKNREWDAVVADESHNIMNNADGSETGILKMLRAITSHARGLQKRFEIKYRTKKIQALMDRIANAQAELAKYDKKKPKRGDDNYVREPVSHATSRARMQQAVQKMQTELFEEWQKVKKAHSDVIGKWENMPQEKKPRVIFLSATPFAYDKDVDYGEGYLWTYPPADSGYNGGNDYEKFMMQHFGYRMRYNKLTKPDGKVDNRVMEVQFHNEMVNAGVMRGRSLEVDKDYDRGFILVDQGIGKKIDDGFRYLYAHRENYDVLYDYLLKRFDKRSQNYLLESIKAGAAVKLARQYEKMGRKVVIFHQAMRVKKNVTPFALPADFAYKHKTQDEATQKLLTQYARFKKAHPELVAINFDDLPSPMETFEQAFGDNALYIDGSSEHKKNRNKAVEQFNDDNSGKNIIIVQQDAGNAGISLHDTTGKHQRVLINIAMPARPSYAMQIEGRIYRVGNQSNAVFRYLAAGTDLEKHLFAETIGARAETVENLALGDKARGLSDSFTQLYLETMSDDWKRRLPNAEGEGTGGKEMDRTVGGDLSDYDRAKAFYFARGKKTSSNKSAEGTDYFATPEPIGYKLIEWLGQKIGDRFLEPSAGHGAISRWSSPNVASTIVEQSGKLAPEAQLVTQGAKLVQGDFMDFDIHNKFEGIAMNPPFGKGGKTAIEHVAKAYKHLADGGRLIAIVPDGPSCEAHFKKWFYGEDKNGEPIKGAVPPADAVLVASVRMPSVMFERAGTSFNTRILVIDKYSNKGDRAEAQSTARGETDLRDIKDINKLFDRMQNMTMPKRVGADRVQNFMPETSNRSKMPYEAHCDNEKIVNHWAIKSAAQDSKGHYDAKRECFVFKTADARKKFMDAADRYVDEHKELFTEQEASSAELPANVEAAINKDVNAFKQSMEAEASHATQQAMANAQAKATPANEHIATSEYTRTDNGEVQPAAKIAYSVSRDTYKAVEGIAKKHGGYYSKFAKQFLFKDAEGRDAFAKAAGEYLQANGGKQFSVSRGPSAGIRSFDEVKAEALAAFPGAKNFNQINDYKFEFTLPNGTHVVVGIKHHIDESKIDGAKARKDHGLNNWESITVDGYTMTREGAAVIALAQNGMIGTAYHEAFHVAYNLALTNAEKAAVKRAYQAEADSRHMDVEEVAAYKYREWAEARKRKEYSNLGRVWEHIKHKAFDILKHLVHSDKEVNEIFEEINNGEIWQKSIDKKMKEVHNEIVENELKEIPSISHMIDDDMDYGVVREHLLRRTNRRLFNLLKLYHQCEKQGKDTSKLLQTLKGVVLHGQERRAFLGERETVSGQVRQALRRANRGRGESRLAQSLAEFDERGLSTLDVLKDLPGEYRKAWNDPLVTSIITEHEAAHGRIGKGGFSIGTDVADKQAGKKEPWDVHYSVSPAETQERAQSFVKRTADKLAKGWHLKGDKIMVEEDAKSDDNVGFFDHLRSPSRVAAKVPKFRVLYQMGTRAMQKVVDLRNDFDRKMKGVYDLVKNKDDKADLFDLLLRGDAEGKEWTTQELLDEGYNENVAEAYKRVRRLMNKAYHMVNEARRGGVPKSATVTQAELDELKTNKFVKLQSVTDKGYTNGVHQYLVSYINYRCYPRGYKQLSQSMIAQFEQDAGIQIMDTKPSRDINGQLVKDADGNQLYDVMTLEGPADMNKLTGYIPHFFHEYFIRVVDGEGNYRVIGSGRNQRDAVIKAEEWLKDNNLKADETIHVVPKTFDFTSVGMSDTDFAPIMGDMDYYSLQRNLVKHNDMTLAEAKSMLDGNVRLKGRHRFFGNALHRTGAEGYETDLGWVLNHYFHSASRYVAMETEFKPKAISYFERMYGRFDDDHAGNTEANYAKDYINDINGNPSTLEQAISKALNSTRLFKYVIIPTFGERAALTFGNGVANKISYLTLGLNMSSALLNFTQLINAAAYLGDVSSLARMVAKGWHHKYTLAELRILKEVGVFADIGLDSGSGYDQMRNISLHKGGKGLIGKLSAANSRMDWLGNKSMLFFREADATCRRGAVLCAYQKAIKEGKSRAEAIAYAREINRKANFDYGVADAPNIFRRGSIISQLTLQFKKFGIKELEVMGDFLGKTANAKQKAMFWGMYFLLAGACGIPALDWFDEVFGEKTGFYSKDKLQKFILNACDGNKQLAAAIMYGAPALAHINVSNRAGLSDVIPTSLGDFAGATLSKSVRFAQDMLGGNYASALRDVSPGLYNLYAAGSGESYGKRDRLNDRYVTLWDRLVRAIGFKSVEESAPVDMQRIISREKSALTKEKQEAQDAYIRDPSSETAAKLKELGVNPKTVQREQANKGKTREERMEQSVPKKDRARYQQYVDFAKE